MVKLMIIREGSNLFIDGLPFKHGTVHIVPMLKKDDLVVEEGKRAYVKVSLYKSGLEVKILRYNDDATLFQQTTRKKKYLLKYDPWNYVSSID